MIIYMIKKEIIQTFRNKFNMFLLFIFPLVSITCMGFALNDLMEGDREIFKGKQVLYSLLNKSEINNIYEESIKNICESLDVTLVKVNEEEGSRLLSSKKADAFIVINEEKITYKEGEDEFLNSILQNYLKEIILNIEVNKQGEIAREIPPIIESSIKEVKVNKGITSFHYYGFVQIALIIMYLSLTLGESIEREWEDETLNRIMISKVNKGAILVSKLFVGILIGSLQILEGVIFTKLILKVNWGPYIKEMIFVLFLFVIVSCLFGVVMGFLIREGKILSSLINTVIIVLALLGGAYLPLSLIKTLPFVGALCKISPVYWVNEALLSLSIGINGEIFNIAIIYLLSLILILTLVYLIGEKSRAGGRWYD